jgi:hypothetical protein
MNIHHEAERPLAMWTVYNSPKDFPAMFVARMFYVWSTGSQPTEKIIMSENVDAIRLQLFRMGLTPINRSEDDDPNIVEVWI